MRKKKTFYVKTRTDTGAIKFSDKYVNFIIQSPEELGNLGELGKLGTYGPSEWTIRSIFDEILKEVEPSLNENIFYAIEEVASKHSLRALYFITQDFVGLEVLHLVSISFKIETNYLPNLAFVHKKRHYQDMQQTIRRHLQEAIDCRVPLEQEE